ncbi:hypothetical protein IQ07DRAFT_628163 [Pyrenochaeta sp. DS3sAY3a]|nr:hypothetical protein IQ07DRAFT_628163 [Pyrenochaeta sp. DS3sAY3a]
MLTRQSSTIVSEHPLDPTRGMFHQKNANSSITKANPDTPGPPLLHQFRESKVISYDQFLTDVYNKKMRCPEAWLKMEEELPDHEFWRKVDQVKNSIKKFKDMALVALSEPEIGSADLDLLEDAINTSGSIRSLCSLLAVVIGGNRVGKSSLVNELVQAQDYISSAGDGKTTFTNVPTTLRCRQDEASASSRFSARVQLLSPNDIQDICEHHVRSIAAHQAYKNLYTGHYKNRARNWAEQLLLAYNLGKRKRGFESTLDNLVGSRSGTDDVHIFTQTCTAWALERIMAITKNKDILIESTCTSPVIHLQAVSWEDLVESLKSFLTRGEYVSGCDKVLTKSIEIFLDANILSTGLKLVDLPDFGDRDPFQARNTSKYIGKSHIRLICANAFCTPSIYEFDAHIARSIREVGVQNTYVVVVRIDSSMTQDAADEAIQSDAAYPFPEIKVHINHAREMIRRLTEGDNSDDETDTSSSDDCATPDSHTQSELERLSAYVSYLQREARIAYAKKRCSAYQEELWIKYYDPKVRDSVKIHFTSAEQYAWCNEHFYDIEERFLDPRASGILRLRHDLLLQTGESSLRALQQHVETSMVSCYQLCVRFCRGQAYPNPEDDGIRTKLAKHLPGMRHIINELGTYLCIPGMLIPDDSNQNPEVA